MNRAVVYVRISRDAAGEGLGVQRQESECRDLCARNGWSVVDVLADNDVSAFSGRRRPGYDRLLELIRDDRVDLVVAWNTDRLHRRLIELIAYTELCKPRSVTTHTVRTGPIDLSTPSGILVAQQLGAVAEYESRNRGARVQAATDQRAAAGKVHGGIRPFGWERDGLTGRESELRLLRDASADVLQGASLQSVARGWREAKVSTTRGKQWRGTTVKLVLLRARNAGLREHRGVVVGVAAWEPAFAPERWHALRQLLTAPGRRTSDHPGAHPRNFGSHRYVCGVCGSRLKSGRWGPDRVRVYMCDQRIGGGKHVSVHGDAADEHVARKLVAAMVEQGVGPRDDSLARETVSTGESRAEIVAAQETLVSELAAGRLPAGSFAAANAQLTQRLAALDAEDAVSTLTRFTDQRLAGFDVAPQETFDALPMDVKRELLGEFVTVTVLPSDGANYRYGTDVGERLRFEWRF